MRTFLTRTVDRLYGHRIPILVLVHVALIVVANQAAFWLRFDGPTPPSQQPYDTEMLPLLIVVRLAFFFPLRLHQGVWRYASIWDLRNILLGVIGSSVVFWAITHGVLAYTLYPRSVFIIDTVLLVCLMGGIRVSFRLVSVPFSRADARRVLVYGAGDAGELMVRDMRSKWPQPYRPIGFIDDDRAKVGLRIHGVPVLGTRHDLAAILERYKPHEVLITIPRAEPVAIRAIVRSLEPFKIPIKTLPNLRDLIDGKVALAKIRNLSVEDLLDRAPVGLDIQPLKALIAGRRVMVTGAGGSIGSELCRQIAGLKPATLVMMDRYENTLHAIRVELDDRKQALGRIPVIGDVTDASLVNAVLMEHQPDIIFHAAAHKHVPLMEENPCEAVKNNVRGTRVLAQAADAHGVERFILISTDKAVNPASMMGASKRVAELVVQAQAVGSGTSFSIVRFGNVLASNGSVVPRFIDQIRKGGPVTVTHPDMRRFFMLIQEAVQLVLHAAAQAQGGATYVLNMGEQVKVLGLARNLIRLSGFIPDDDIKIEFTGMRSGEKLCEELVGPDEEARPSAVTNILCVRSTRQPEPDLFAQIDALERDASAGRRDAVIAAMKALVGAFGRVDEPPAHTDEVQPIPIGAAVDARGEDLQPCPRCHVGRVHRSRARNMAERMKRGVTSKRLFRCSGCGWRGWLTPLTFGEHVPVEVLPAPDLTALDAVIKSESIPRRRFSPRDLR